MSLTSYQAAPPCIKGRGNVLAHSGSVKRAFVVEFVVTKQGGAPKAFKVF
jgi:hypothetical protein